MKSALRFALLLALSAPLVALGANYLPVRGLHPMTAELIAVHANSSPMDTLIGKSTARLDTGRNRLVSDKSVSQAPQQSSSTENYNSLPIIPIIAAGVLIGGIVAASKAR